MQTHTHTRTQTVTSREVVKCNASAAPEKNIAYFGAETKTKKCGRKWRRLLGAPRPRTRRAREREGKEQKRQKARGRESVG